MKFVLEWGQCVPSGRGSLAPHAGLSSQPHLLLQLCEFKAGVVSCPSWKRGHAVCAVSCHCPFTLAGGSRCGGQGQPLSHSALGHFTPLSPGGATPCGVEEGSLGIMTSFAPGLPVGPLIWVWGDREGARVLQTEAAAPCLQLGECEGQTHPGKGILCPYCTSVSAAPGVWTGQES